MFCLVFAFVVVAVVVSHAHIFSIFSHFCLPFHLTASASGGVEGALHVSALPAATLTVTATMLPCIACKNYEYNGKREREKEKN